MQTVAKFHLTALAMKKKTADILEHTKEMRASVARVQLMLDIARQMLGCVEHNPDYVIGAQKVAIDVKSVTGPDYDVVHWDEDSKRFLEAVQKENFQCRIGFYHEHVTDTIACRDARCANGAFHFAW